MLLLRGKLRLFHKMRSVPNPPPHPPGAELQNRRGGGLAHSDETDRLEFHLSQKGQLYHVPKLKMYLEFICPFLSFFSGRYQVSCYYQLSLLQVAKGLVVDIRDSSSKPSCFIFLAKFISKMNEAGSMLPFSLKKKKKVSCYCTNNPESMFSRLNRANGFRGIKQLFLGYLPVERDAWERELARNRSRYAELKDELLANPLESSRTTGEASTSNKQHAKNDDDGLLSRREVFNGNHPLSLGNGSVWLQFFKDAEIVEQIDRDLQRTHPGIDFFSVDFPCSEKHRDAMRNILLLFAKLNPAIGYVQGMNEVLAPLYYVFRTQADEQNASNAEADSFSCFVRLLSGSVDHFCQQLDYSSVGIHSTLSRLSELLKINDEELWQHLENTKVNPQFYAFRWITLLLTQEFKFHSTMRIWDCLLSNPWGVQEMLLRVCCAMLLCAKHELLNGDFASNLKLLQHYPEIDLETLLDVACHLIPCSPTLLLHC